MIIRVCTGFEVTVTEDEHTLGDRYRIVPYRIVPCCAASFRTVTVCMIGPRPCPCQTAERHAALTEEVASQLDWLHEREATIKSRPALTMDDAELRRHCDESQVRRRAGLRL